MFSIIIPTLDEAVSLQRTFSALQNVRGQFEVIVADGGSRDATRKVAEEFGARVVKSARGVPEQLTTGLIHARGDPVLFLHADCQLPRDALEQIEESNARAGGFLHHYDKFHPLSSVQAALNNGNARLFGRFCGEQAFFVKKSALSDIGGLPDAFVCETEVLSNALSKSGVEPRLLQGPVVSSNRRYQKGGIPAFLSINWAHVLQPLGASPYKLKKHFGRVR